VNLKVSMLGTGTSHGVPMIGCDCRTCHSTDPRDRRSRPSILIERTDPPDGSPFQQSVRHILVDTSTDLRAQALALNLRRVDAILYTHSHADHILGLDEVRRFNVIQKSAIPAYGDARTVADLRQTFSYIFDAATPQGGGIPKLSLSTIAGPFSLGGIEIVPVPVMHGRRPILGYRIGSFAYLTDCNAIPDTSWPLLEGVRTLVLDALRDRPHSTHFSVAEAVDAAARIGAGRTCFTHICHDLPHAETCARLPRGVELAYDGQVLEITG
jgi:phosphoribosyl 1,2-cyclic phosphate phosphodiesterase